MDASNISYDDSDIPFMKRPAVISQDGLEQIRKESLSTAVRASELDSGDRRQKRRESHDDTARKKYK